MTDRYQKTIIFLIAALIGIVIVVFPYDSGGGLVLLGTAVILGSIILLPRMSPVEDRRFLRSILVYALIAKVIATGFRLFMNDVVYRGGDLNRFDRAGASIATDIRAGDFSGAFSGFQIGTSSMEILTGIVYSITGTSFVGVFLLSGFLGFVAAVLFYRAFRIAFPNGNYRLYALLIFFYPAVLYWPTGFGKDVIIFLGLSLTLWGTALFIVQLRLSGLFVSIVGLLVMFLIRPEVGLMAAVAFITAFVLRKPSTVRKAFLFQLIGVPIVLFSGFVFLSQATSFLGLDDLSLASALTVITEQSSQVFDEGRSGSNFVPPTVGTPTWIPETFVTVLFRPFPWEVGNLPALIQSLDGAILGLMVLLTSGRLFRAFKKEGRNPIIVFSLVFVLMSVIALGTLGNFGLLARQRVIVLPFIFLMISAVNITRRRFADPQPEPADSPTVTTPRLATDGTV